MQYTILTNCEYKEACDRCGAPLQTAVQFYQDSQRVVVGRECAKHYGITWTEKIGPMANDPATYQQAVEIWRAKHFDHKNGYRWPGGWDACNLVKQLLGSELWRKAMNEAVRYG